MEKVSVGMDNLIEKIERDINLIKLNDIKNKRVLYDGEFITLTRGEYYLNNGKVIDRECISNKMGNGRAVCIFAVTDDNKILLVIQPRVVLDENKGVNIEIPAGYEEIGEDSVVAGIRELKEETGYVPGKVIKLDSYHTSIGFSSEIIDLLLAVDCKKISSQELDRDEVIIVEKVSLEEFEYLLNNNYIMDINTKMGYYRYKDYLGGKSNG